MQHDEPRRWIVARAIHICARECLPIPGSYSPAAGTPPYVIPDRKEST
jgi:hypothetical protein